MTSVWAYFGLPDVQDLANRVLSADPTDIDARQSYCTVVHSTLTNTAKELDGLATTLDGHWKGHAGTVAIGKLRDAASQRSQQATQFHQSAASYKRVAAAVRTVQKAANTAVSDSAGLDKELDSALSKANTAINALSPASGLLEWGVKKLSGVDLEAEADKIVLDLTRPIWERASGIESTLNTALNTYGAVLTAEAKILEAMKGIVRTDAGPKDVKGDATLRQDALFYDIYGRYPTSPNDRMMAQALDPQGQDSNNDDPNSRVVVIRINKVPGAGVIHGDAFIGQGSEADPHTDNPFEQDKGDHRGFDPDALPDDSRVSYYIDYDNGVVVIRQNASHTTDGHAEVQDPNVGVEQDKDGRVRIHLEATNPLAMQPGQDLHVSVRGDVVVDPHHGHGTADVNGKVTRFPSWEIYQSKDGQPPQTLLQRHENDLPLGAGPGAGLPLPTVPVGHDPGQIDNWRHAYHPDQGHQSELDRLLQYPSTRDDDFFQYPVDNAPYPTFAGSGGLVVPHAHEVR